MKIKKFTILASLIIIVISNISLCFGTTGETNKDKFLNIKSSRISVVGVAITTNVGIRGKYNKNEIIKNTIFNEIISIDGILSIRNNKKDSLISNNIAYIKEYLNLLKSDVKKMLTKSSNTKKTLETFIKKLEIKYKSSVTNKINLEKQKIVLQSGLVDTDKKIQDIKSKISKDFREFNSIETNKNIKEYLKLREQYTIIRTYLIFVNKFINQYDFLNSYNKNLLDTLINNKDIISKKSFVVIPDTGTDLLKQLDLIISESEFKEEKKKN
ncbi:hypothetical protein CSA08_03110 [Candidatus Gracilibacteria bacterium]|nr:MAG: hypothetical protein CSA08_03110 [Candidatus Gracilibacteria bacterium]